MIISNKYIFFHIPKTGGTALYPYLTTNDRKNRPRKLTKTDYVKDLDRTHLSYLNLPVYVPKEKVKSLYKFCFVRNPYDRLLSAYFFYRKRKRTDTYWNFLENQVSGENIFRRINVHLCPMYHFMLDRDGQNQMDFIGRMENYNEDLKKLIGILGIKEKVPLKRYNYWSSHAKDLYCYWDLYHFELISKVNEIYGRDFLDFNYQKLSSEDFPKFEDLSEEIQNQILSPKKIKK